jgi:hypothetical protein
MRHRFLVSVSAVAVIGGVAALAPVSVTGHGRRSAAKSATEKSTPTLTTWGKPDLNGVWDFRTVTPLERPGHLAGKERLTEAEVAAVGQQAAENQVGRAPRTGSTGQFWFDYGTDVVGTKRTSLIIDPPMADFPR